MSVKDTVQQFAVNQALKYIEGNPDENIPKLMEYAGPLRVKKAVKDLIGVWL